MRSPLSGPIATLLMFVPLVAIPVFAVFGMPQFSTQSPAAQAEDLKFAPDKDRPSPKTLPPEGDLGAGVQVTESASPPQTTEATLGAARNDSDPFAEFVRPSQGDAAHSAEGDAPRAKSNAGNRSFSPARRPQRWPSDEQSNPPQSPPVTLSEAATDDGRTTRPDGDPASAPTNVNSQEQKRSKSGIRPTAVFDANRQRPDADRGATDAVKGASDEAQSWKAAVARLNALGIRDYQMQPGEREGEFHFSCLFVSRSNPRVVRRFEAEAAEPLEAVEQVLAQVDQWRGRRADSGGRTSTQKSPSNVAALAPAEETVPVSALDVSDR